MLTRNAHHSRDNHIQAGIPSTLNESACFGHSLLLSRSAKGTRPPNTDIRDAAPGTSSHHSPLSTLRSPLSTRYSPLATFHSPLSTLHSPPLPPAESPPAHSMFCGLVYKEETNPGPGGSMRTRRSKGLKFRLWKTSKPDPVVIQPQQVRDISWVHRSPSTPSQFTRSTTTLLASTMDPWSRPRHPG
jgi:hypothetical protein